MADAARAVSPGDVTSESPRHHAVVRVTHWLNALCFFALLITGVNIVISHPRFYWGETGNVTTPALFQLPIPASRPYVRTGYDFVVADQNGWSRALHFQAAWAFVFTGLVFLTFALWSGHLRNHLAPRRGELAWKAMSETILRHFREKPRVTDPYNTLQRLTYLAVLFGLVPLMIWTGLAMSPAVVSAAPGIVTVLGGHQSARTIHFLVSIGLVVFLVIHVAMVALGGFKSYMRAMITGRAIHKEAP